MRAGMLIAFAVSCACSPSVFGCVDDSGCAGSDAGGFCEPSGFCSFPDDACPSGRRYGEFSGQGLGGVCVDAPDSGTSQPDPTTSTGFTTSVSTSTSTTAPGEASGATSGVTNIDTESSTTQVSSTGSVCPDDWWDCDWTVRQSIVLRAMPLDAPVSALPFSARLEPGLLEDKSLVFVDASGQLVPWERDGTLVWLTMDVEPDTETSVWAYGANPAGPPAEPPQSVWDDSFVAVWHLSDGSDASSLNNDAVPNGVVPEDGRFDAATRFDGVDDQLDVPATMSLADLRATGLTADVWLRPELAMGTTFKRIFDKSESTTATMGWAILLSHTLPLAQIQVDVGYELAEGRAMSEEFDATDWVHLVVTIETDDTIGFWVNGVALESSQTPVDGTILSDAAQPGSIGSRPGETGSVRFYDGLMDEFRVSRGVRSQAWVVATYTSGLPDAVAIGRSEDLQEQ